MASSRWLDPNWAASSFVSCARSAFSPSSCFTRAPFFFASSARRLRSSSHARAAASSLSFVWQGGGGGGGAGGHQVSE